MKILYVSPHFPIWKPPNDGPTRRIFNITSFIAENFELITLEQEQFKEEHSPPNRYYFKSIHHIRVQHLTLGSLLLDLNPSYLMTLSRIIKTERPDVILISFPQGLLSAKLLSRIFKRRIGKTIRVVYNSHNVEKQYAKVVVYHDKNLPKTFRLLYVAYLSIIEYLAVISADYVFSVSQENKRLLSKEYVISPEKITTLQSGLPLTSERQIVQSSDSNQHNKQEVIRVVFHGTYSKYRAFHNKEAVDIIIGYISPNVRYKNILFVLAGKGMPKTKRENIKSAGFVEELDKFLASCDIAIVPLKRGEGTKLKIFDYLKAGLPIITTKKGIEGIEFLANGKHIIAVDDVNTEFIRKIEFLIETPKIRRKMRHNVIKQVYKTIDETKKSALMLFTKIGGVNQWM